MKYPAENWKTLGEWVALARRARGYVETSRWVEAVGRTDRMLLGLERGEEVGDKTLERVADALGMNVGLLYMILASGSIEDLEARAAAQLAATNEPVGPPKQDAKYVASPGERVEAGESDDAVLRAINAMRADVEKLAGVPEALADLARRMETVERRTESLDGPGGTS